MSLDESQFPELIRDLYRVVGNLEAMFPGRPFTPDGHLVGSLGECFAAFYYGLTLCACSNEGHDALAGDLQVEIKATQGASVGLRSGPAHLLVLRLARDGSFDEVYNGPGAPIWALFEGKPRPSNGQYHVSLARLRRLAENVEPGRRLVPVRQLPMS